VFVKPYSLVAIYHRFGETATVADPRLRLLLSLKLSRCPTGDVSSGFFSLCLSRQRQCLQQSSMFSCFVVDTWALLWEGELTATLTVCWYMLSVCRPVMSPGMPSCVTPPCTCQYSAQTSLPGCPPVSHLPAPVSMPPRHLSRDALLCHTSPSTCQYAAQTSLPGCPPVSHDILQHLSVCRPDISLGCPPVSHDISQHLSVCRPDISLGCPPVSHDISQHLSVCRPDITLGCPPVSHDISQHLCGWKAPRP
jgi:hypothetical protein